MIQIVETRSSPDTRPETRLQQDSTAPPRDSEESGALEEATWVSPPPIPWPRVFPGL
jgi:hypothetical protein